MEQCSENHVTLASSCETPQLADGNSTKEHSNDQKLMERESPDSPSPVKRWEIGPLLQSFKSKMASFTEIVMSPVRLFKPTDTLSSIVHPDQDEKLIESNEETSAGTEEGETSDDKCKNELLSKRLSSERVQCISPPKRHRVAQRLNFETISTSNHESVLECNQMHKDIKEDQTTRPATQVQTVLQDKKCNPSFCTTQSTVLNYKSVPSPDRPLNSSHHLHGSSQANIKINLLKGEDTDRSGSEESCSPAIRKSPRKALKHVSAELESSGSGPKTLNNRMKLHTNNVKEQMHHSTKVSDPPKSTSVGHVRSKRCREALRNNTKKDMMAKRKPDLRKAEDRGLRRAKNKKVKDSSITLEESQEDVICVQMRKKRKGITTEQKLQDPNNGLNTADVKIRYSETSESCDSTETKEIGQVKSLKTNLRKNIKCKTLLTSSNEGDTETASQNKTGNVLLDKSLHCSNMNTIIDYEDYENSTPSDLKTHKAEKTIAQKARHIFKTPGEASIQKRIVRPPKHKFEDYSTTLVVDPAGPSRPSKRTLYQSDRSCVDSQRTIIAEEQQVTSLCGPETREDKKKFALPAVQPESTVSLRSEKERKPSRPTKTVNKPKRKLHISVKRINGGKDIPEQMMEAIPIESLSGSGFNRLLRSYSCPELPSLVFSDCHVPPSPTHEKYSTSNTNKSTAVPSHLHSPFKRTRRHTVCSVEIEREIAPLCLRKEVYPSSRGSHSSPYSPSNSLTALASCFLSSPLAFLSKNSSHERGHASDISTSSAYSDASCFTSGYVTSSSPSLCSSPFASSLASSNPDSVVTPSPKIPSASVSSLCSSSQGALEGDLGILQMECRRAMDEERSSFSLQLSTAISEEKAFSDSEIKTDIKEGQRGKVSSIRICRKIPKPQNNLTPMGLPKVIRIKKKDFSLEEIYTNKNFSKPPDGRLETIFEVPLNRRDGSQVVAGQKKVKRFVEFPELGVARKPKKPLVGGTAGGGAQRKAGGNSGICRTRRGVGASSKVEDGLTLQELDTLLCSKLQELDTWMALQQVAC